MVLKLLTAAATGNVNKVAIIVITISNPDLSKRLLTQWQLTLD